MFAICMQTPNINEKNKEKKKKNDFSLKTIKPTSCTLGILKFNQHRLNLPLHPFTTPPPIHTVLNKIVKGSHFSWCGNVG